jgi:hypothetical protein
MLRQYSDCVQSVFTQYEPYPNSIGQYSTIPLANIKAECKAVFRLGSRSYQLVFRKYWWNIIYTVVRQIQAVQCSRS